MNIASAIINEVEKVLLGKPKAVRLAVTCILAEGHVLIDDIPGVGKTTLATCLAKSIGCDFQRIQFTSDLLPSDVLGISVFNPTNNSFSFKPGPIFHHVILADEINRASPKTQSALLESMQEGQVSMDNETHALPSPFLVIATENPHEHHGTFPLPESQLDRFMMRLNLGYPDAATEAAILKGDSIGKRSAPIQAVTDGQKMREAIAAVRTIKVDESLDHYMVQIANSTRTSPMVELGLSPRGTLAMRRAVQSYAFTQDRNYVIPDDIKEVASSVMAHRIRLRGAYNGNTQTTAQTLISELINQVPIPT